MTAETTQGGGQSPEVVALVEELKWLRVRAFGSHPVRGTDHSTACLIWGDDGQGGTAEGFAQPLPCTCGALINYERKRADAALAALKAAPLPPAPDPIPMVLHCPACGLQHIDRAEYSPATMQQPAEIAWDNPPHRSHLCHGCGHIWRPADVPTEGVAAVQTKGSADSAIVSARSHNTALSEAVGALEAIRHMSSPAKRIDEPRLRLDAVSDLAAATLSRLNSSTGGREP